MQDLERTDIAILGLLQQDASLSTGSIAERVNLSQSPCWRRINRLEQAGYIDRRVALLNRQALGMELVVFATIRLTAHGRQALAAFDREIGRHPEVVACYTMAGIWDYLLKIVVRDIRHYETLLRTHLLSLPHIGELHSHMAVTEIKHTTELPLQTQLRRAETRW